MFNLGDIMAVLDWFKVEEIREAWEGGATQSSLSVRFGVSLNTIGKIVKGQSWVRKGQVMVARREDPDAILQRLLAQQAKLEPRAIPRSPLDEEMGL